MTSKMKSISLRAAGWALSLLPAVPAFAAYNPAIVAADAQWVLHADFAALRAGTIGQELVAAIEKAQGQATGGMMGLDIPKALLTVGSLTAYGTNLSGDPNAIDGALIAQGTDDLRKIAESLLLQGTLAQPEVFTEAKDYPFPAYAITDPKAPAARRMQVIVAFPPEPIIVVSKSRAQVLKAREVFRGAAPSLASGGSSPLGKLTGNAAGAYLFAASVLPTEPLFPQNAPQARLLQLASSGSLAIGERGPDVFAHAELLASSEQSADKLMKILQGMTAALSLAETNDRQLAEFLNATGVSREKETVTLRLAYPSARLAQMGKALQGQVENRPVNRPQPITTGRTLAEWSAEPAAPGTAPAGGEVALVTRTIENVKLENSVAITVGRALNGGRNARFDRVEIAPADGSGSPLIFRSEFMRAVGGRGTMSQFQFPGADGTYTLKVVYVNDPEGKAKYAVSVAEPKARPAPAGR